MTKRAAPAVQSKGKGARGGRLVRRIGVLALLAFAPIALVAGGFALYVYVGVRAGADAPAGSLAGFGVREPVTIVRDARGIPHVRAKNEHDLFFADGYLQGVDRLFQLDIYKRAVAGRLSEVLGSSTLASDEAARVCDVRAIAHEQLALLPAAQRANLKAFADGVNAAIETRPLPPEFRALAYRPEPWTAEDSLVSSFSTVLALTDTWDDVATRLDVANAVGPHAADAFFSISDPAYDAPTTGGPPAPVATLPPLDVILPVPRPTPTRRVAAGDARAGAGSNDFAAGAALTSTHRALLANDPHLELRIPGVWWLVDLAAPGYHAAGTTFAGVPGVILGHNAHVAWGATNGTVTTVRVYVEHFKSATSDEYLANGSWLHARHRSETFHVRFAPDVERDYLRTRHGFVFRDAGVTRYAAAWTADMDRHSSFAQFDALDRASTAAAAFEALATYPGPPQNFVLADDRGNAGYVLAGEIPIDDAWGLRAHDGPSEGVPSDRNVPFAALPHVAVGPRAFAFTANDRVYAAGYPYRLSAAFSPPYRARRIADLLAKPPYDVARFSAVQADVTSLPERELAHRAAAAIDRLPGAPGSKLRDAARMLRTFDGRFTPDSTAAVYVYAVRVAAVDRLVRMHMPPATADAYLKSSGGDAFVTLMRALRDRPHGWVPGDDFDAFLGESVRGALASLADRKLTGETWADAGARTARHPLSFLGFDGFNGVRFPGNGDGYSPHVQAPANAQSFRAVWDVGNWNAGGIVIPLGESGEPGSPHYRDLAATWLGGTLVPFPFDDVAVQRAAVERLELDP